jgi:N-hydroxyarylamine O-acetyltransferase
MSAAELRLPELAGFDLDAYLARIGYRGERAPTLATLREVQWRQVTAIAFENLSSLAGEPVPIELPALQAKLVHGRRGGYCYEQNVLFAAALMRLGFAVTGLAARVVWNAVPGAANPRSHMLLRLELAEGNFIADTGFGGASLPGPLQLLTDVAQPTPIESYRLAGHAEGYQLEVQLPGEWKPVYVFDLQPQQFVDYQMANWFVSTHPHSRFVQTLMVARPEGRRRRTLLDAELGLREVDGSVERRRLGSVGELRLTLAGLFGIDVPDGPRMDAALERVVARNR